MKYQILIEILYMLLARGKVSAKSIAERFNVSKRTVYRYMTEIELANVPLIVNRGTNGGFSIAETFKMPCGFLTEKEYSRLFNVIETFESQIGQTAELESIKDKLKSTAKNETAVNLQSNQLIIDGGDWFGNASFKNKLAVITKAINKCITLEMRYHDREGNVTGRQIEPHALVLKQGVWYVYAFCYLRNDFRLFKIGRIEYANPAGNFTRREFTSPVLPFDQWYTSHEPMQFRFEVSREVKSDVEEWLGIENVRELKNGKIVASAKLPYDKGLIFQIMKFGSGIKVIKPDFVKREIVNQLNLLLKIYEK